MSATTFNALLGHNNPPEITIERRFADIVEAAARALATLCRFAYPEMIRQKRKGPTALTLRQWLIYGLTDDDPERGIVPVTQLAAILGFDRGTIRDDRNVVKGAVLVDDMIAEFSEYVQELCNITPGFTDHAETAIKRMEKVRTDLRGVKKRAEPRLSPAPAARSRAEQILTEMGRFDLADRAHDLQDTHRLHKREAEQRKRTEAQWKVRDERIKAEERRPRRRAPPSLARGAT